MTPPSVLSSILTWLVAGAVSSPNAVILNTVELAPVMVAEPEFGYTLVATFLNGVIIVKVAVPPIALLANWKVIAVKLRRES